VRQIGAADDRERNRESAMLRIGRGRTARIYDAARFETDVCRCAFFVISTPQDAGAFGAAAELADQYRFAALLYRSACFGFG
jgi:hypothetical protein